MNFVLTHQWFDKIKSGEKTHEYRAHTAYWCKRINKLQKGGSITFSRGYTKNRVHAEIKDIQYISESRLSRQDAEAHAFLYDKCHAFWDIEFTLLEGKEND